MQIRRMLNSIFRLALLGLVLALLATWQTVDVWMHRSHLAFMCTFIDWADCSALHLSRYALVAGVPIAWFGFMFYWWLSMLTGWTLLKHEPSPVAIKAVYQISFLALTFHCYQMFAMAFKLHRMCAICMVVFVLNLGIFLLAASAHRSCFASRALPGFSASISAHYASIVLILAVGYWLIRSAVSFNQESVARVHSPVALRLPQGSRPGKHCGRCSTRHGDNLLWQPHPGGRQY